MDVRNRFVGSFVYQPKFFEGNAILKQAVDGFVFSGTEIASAGQPIVASMSGTVVGGADGNIYGGAMSSGSGSATTGRPPQIGRNSLIGPGFNDFDFRVTRDVPIHQGIHAQFIAEAFNLLNHKIVTSVNSTYSTYTSASATSTSCPTTSAAPAGSTFTGCITPYAGTGTAAFGNVSGTNNVLYGPRQLQVSAKLFF